MHASAAIWAGKLVLRLSCCHCVMRAFVTSVNTETYSTVIIADVITALYADLFEAPARSVVSSILLSTNRFSLYANGPAQTSGRHQEDTTYGTRHVAIAPVAEPTPWISALLVVTKPNGICIDPKPLNKALMRDHYSMSTVDVRRCSLLSELSQVKVYSIVDASNAFWNVCLEEKSSKVIAIRLTRRLEIWKVSLASSAVLYLASSSLQSCSSSSVARMRRRVYCR